jgi:hypothetical protein
VTWFNVKKFSSSYQTVLQTQVDGLQLRIEYCLHICYLYFIFVWIGTTEEVLPHVEGHY